MTPRWYDLRQFAISTWIDQRFSIKEAMIFAGPFSVQITMEYDRHLFPTPNHERVVPLVEQRTFG